MSPGRASAWHAAYAVAHKDLRDLAREKSILAALLVQAFVAAFSAFLTVGLLGLYDPSSVEAFPPADVAFVPAAADAGDGFDGLLARQRNLDLRLAGAEAAVAAFRAGEVDAVVEERWPAGPGGAREVTVLVAEGSIQATLLLTQFKSLLADYEFSLRQKNEAAGRLESLVVEVPEGREGRVPYAFVYATLVPLLFVTPVFLSGAIAGDSVVQEVQRGTLAVLRSGPASTSALLVGKLAVPLLLAPAQFLLWCGLLALNGLPVANPLPLALLSMAMAMLLAAGSVPLAAAVGREGPVQTTYAFAVILLALASLWLPHDPFALVARIAADSVSAGVVATGVGIAVLSVAAAAVAWPWAARRLDQA